MGAPRFLFYAVNGLGLGHVTRLLSIARALKRLSPECEVLFLTSSEADHVIYREGFAAVKLPSKTIRERCGLRKGIYHKLVQTVTWNTLAAVDPDVLVGDTYPTGRFEELIPVLRWRQRNLFVFREQRSESAGSDQLQTTLRLYALNLKPHHSGSQVGPLPEPAKAPAVGPHHNPERQELRRFTHRFGDRQLGMTGHRGDRAARRIAVRHEEGRHEVGGVKRRFPRHRPQGGRGAKTSQSCGREGHRGLLATDCTASNTKASKERPRSPTGRVARA
jgi:hypothetical protein